MNLTPPPNSESCEKSVLSTMLQNPNEYIPEALNLLSVDSFYKPSHGKFFKILLEHFKDGKTIELVSLTQYLLDRELLNPLGGPSAITEIYTYAPTSAHFFSHCEVLNKSKVRRMSIRASEELKRRAEDASDEDFLEAAGKPITTLFEQLAGSPDERTNKDLAKSALERIKDKITGESSPIGIPTGYPQIDEVLKGLHPGRVWIISARPSCGKSALAALITWKVACQNIPTLFLSLEMSDDDLTDRVMVPASGLKSLAIQDPAGYAEGLGRESLSRGELMKIKEAGEKIESLPYYIHDGSSGMTIEQIESLARMRVRRDGIKVLAIDYAQLIKGDRKSSREEMLTDVSRRVKDLAASLGISILLLSQENNEGSTKFCSSFGDDCAATLRIMVEQDPDADDYKKPLGILIAKDRYYSQGGRLIDLYLNGEYFEFFPWREKKWES